MFRPPPRYSSSPCLGFPHEGARRKTVYNRAVNRLAIVKAIVEAHGGTVGVTSQLRNGSLLATEIFSSNVSARVEHRYPGNAMNRPNVQEPRRILVADDEPQITRVLRTTLSSHGYAIRTAGDG